MEVMFDVGGKKQTIDLGRIAFGLSPRYRLINVEGRLCLQVSEVCEIKTPECNAAPNLRKVFVVDINRNAKVGELHVCYEVLFDDDGSPSLLVDGGFNFLRDKKEFGRYVLWNDVTGELSVSGELDWREVGLYSSQEFAEQTCRIMNRILAKKPIQDAVMGEEFQSLHGYLAASNWRVIIDAFKKVDGQTYGRGRVVSADSEDYHRIMGFGVVGPGMPSEAWLNYRDERNSNHIRNRT